MRLVIIVKIITELNNIFFVISYRNYQITEITEITKKLLNKKKSAYYDSHNLMNVFDNSSPLPNFGNSNNSILLFELYGTL